MQTLFTIARKDLTLILRDPLGLFFIAGFPVLMGVLFGLIMGGMSVDSASLEIALVDEDGSAMSARFAESLTDTGNVDIRAMKRDAAIEAVRRGKLTGLIAIPKGFGKTAGIFWEEGPAIQVGVDPARKAEAAMLEGIIMQAMGKLIAVRMQDPESYRPMIRQAKEEISVDQEISPVVRPLLMQLMDRLDTFLDALDELQANESDTDAGRNGDENGKGSVGFNVMQFAQIESLDVTREIDPDSTEALIRKLRSRWDLSFPQSMQWGILACAAGFAVTLVREKKQGTYLRLAVAPVTRGQILAGKGLACFIAVIVVILMMVVLGIALGMRPRSPGLLAVAGICIAFCFVGIMMLMSVLGKSEEAVGGAAWGINMILAMFGGAMVPLMFMPGFMRAISHFSPVKWSTLALEGAIWRGFTLGEMMLPCAVLVITGGVCLAIGVYVLSRRTA